MPAPAGGRRRIERVGKLRQAESDSAQRYADGRQGRLHAGIVNPFQQAVMRWGGFESPYLHQITLATSFRRMRRSESAQPVSRSTSSKSVPGSRVKTANAYSMSGAACHDVRRRPHLGRCTEHGEIRQPLIAWKQAGSAGRPLHFLDHPGQLLAARLSPRP